MNNNRYIYTLILSAFFMLLLVQPLLFFANLDLHMGKQEYIAKWISYKKQLLTNVDGNKMVIISGSNTLFGINAKQMENRLGIPVINLGLHAGLDEYVLHVFRDNLKSGDIVILPLEYNYYNLNNISGEGLGYIIHFDSNYICHLPISSQIKFIYGCSTYELLQGVKLRIFPTHTDSSNYSYRAENFNENGDTTGNTVEKSNILEPSSKQEVFRSDNIPNDISRQELHNFVVWCNENNIKIYAAWPSFLIKEQSFNEDDIKKIDNIIKFWQQENVIILGNYEDTLYKNDYFFDSTYHLNEFGREIRTTYLLEQIEQCDGIFTEINNIKNVNSNKNGHQPI